MTSCRNLFPFPHLRLSISNSQNSQNLSLGRGFLAFLSILCLREVRYVSHGSDTKEGHSSTNFSSLTLISQFSRPLLRAGGWSNIWNSDHSLYSSLRQEGLLYSKNFFRKIFDIQSVNTSVRKHRLSCITTMAVVSPKYLRNSLQIIDPWWKTWSNSTDSSSRYYITGSVVV